MEVDAFEDQGELGRFKVDVGGAGGALSREAKTPTLKTLCDQYKARSIPEEQPDLMTSLADEAEDVSGEGLKRQGRQDRSGQRVDASSAVHGGGREVDSNRGR